MSLRAWLVYGGSAESRFPGRGSRARQGYIARLAQARGLDVRLGTFPDALPADLRFEVITFHDVFEHMPDLGPCAGSLSSCAERIGLVGDYFTFQSWARCFGQRGGSRALAYVGRSIDSGRSAFRHRI